MIIAQVCLRLATIQFHSKMCSFITQHNATYVASFEGACNWHADCRNVHQSCCPWIECPFIYHKPSPKSFHRIWKYIQPASQPQTTCNHISPGPPHPASSPPRSSETAATIGLHNQRISAQTVRNRLREAHLHARRPHRGLDLTAVRHLNRLEWANAHIRWCLALWRGVLFTDKSQVSLYRADGRQCVWRFVVERFADVNVMDRVAHGGVMVWAGVCYGQWTQVHFIDGILNAQRYRDETLRPIVVPFIQDHHLILQNNNARPHVARICTQFLEAENIPVIAWPAYSPNLSPIEHVWDALDRRIRQRVQVPANIQQLRTAIEEEWTNISQATINLINFMRRRCVALREANGGHSRYWLVFGPHGPSQCSKTAHFRVDFYSGQPKAHLCNNHAV